MRTLAILGLTIALATPALADERSPIRVGPVTLRFPGARAIAWSALADLIESEITDFARTGFDQVYAEDAADRMRRHYLTEGHARADVTYDEDASRPMHGELTFSVREGPRLLIGSVTVEGNVGIDEETLREFVRRRPGILREPVLVEHRLRSDLRAIETYYAERGWLTARAELRWSVPEEPGDEAEVDLNVVLTEGPRTRLDPADIVIVGARDVPESELREIVDRVLAGEADDAGFIPYDRMLPYRLRGVLRDRYGVRGYPFCRISDRFETSEDGTRGHLTLTITEGAWARVVAVDIEGNFHAPDHVIRREISLDRDEDETEGGTIDIGDAYDVRRVRNAHLALLRLGIFTSVRIDPRPVPGDPEGVILRIRVKEKEPRTLDLRVGFGSYDLWRLGLSYRNRIWSGPGDALGLDWIGHAMRLKIEAEASGRGFGLSGRIRDPRVLFTRVEAALDASLEQRENVSFSYRRAGVVLGLGRALREVDPALRIEAAWSYRVTDTFHVVGELSEDFEDVVNLSSISLGLMRDWRDSRLWPTRGGHGSLRGELADRRLGGDVDFLRFTAEGSGHFPFDEAGDLVFSLGVRVGVVVPQSPTEEIPLSERFFAGGADTVRSFEEQKLGPSVGGEPAGGEARLILNAEFRVPVVRPVYAAIFVDAGNVWSRVEDLGFEDLRYGLGGGVRVRTPVGPLSLDAAWNPSPRGGESTWAFHFSVGFAF